MTKSYIYITDTIIREILSFVENWGYRVGILSHQAKTNIRIKESHQLRLYLIPYRILVLPLVSICNSVYLSFTGSHKYYSTKCSSFRFVIHALVRPLGTPKTLLYTAPGLWRKMYEGAGGCPPSVSALYCHGSP